MDSTNLDEKKKKECICSEQNFLSTLFFSWTLPLFWKGRKNGISEKELYPPPKTQNSSNLGKQLEEEWKLEVLTQKAPSLHRVLWKVFGKEFILFGVLLVFLEFVVKIIQPLALWRLMIYYTAKQTTISQDEAYICSSLIIFSSFINVVVYHSFVFNMLNFGTKIKIACCSLVYRKALRLNRSNATQTASGQVINLISNDISRFDKCFQNIHFLWCAPVQSLLIAYLLYIMLGLAALAGFVIFFAFIPLQMYMGKLWSHLRAKTARKTDERVRLLNEVISGIQIIKMYTWEKIFMKQIDKARKEEIKYVRKTSYLKALYTSFNKSMTRSSVFIAVITFILTGHHLQAQYIFVLKSFFTIVKESMTTKLPAAISDLAEIAITIGRIQEVLSCEEAISKAIHKKTELHRHSSLVYKRANPGKTIGVFFEELSARWTPDVDVLSDVTFTAAPKQLVAIVGHIGSGKTSLLNAVLNELPISRGTREVIGRVSYAPQEPWIFAGTIKQNILFGLPMNNKRYKEVIKACSLERDFQILPHGDSSHVGEKGVTLSGGQRARISLARAVYRDVDVYLLDDPLSAVDPAVGKQLFEGCVLNYLKNKCVILVTHQLQYLKNISSIYLMESGRVVASGSYEEVLKSESDFAKLLEATSKNEEVDSFEHDTKSSWKKNDEPELDEETRSSGSVSRTVYKQYLKSGGGFFWLGTILLFFILGQVLASSSDYFEAFWVNLEESRDIETATIFTRQNCIYIYSGLIIGIIVFTVLRSMYFFAYFTVASINMHNKMFSSVTEAAMKFFHENVSGRILNRFSKDTGVMDETLPVVLMDTIQIGLNVLAVTLIIAIVNPWLTLVTIGMFLLFYVLRSVYLATSRDVKRIEATARSPVITHLNSSLQGLTTIRALAVENKLTEEFDELQNQHASCYYTFLSCASTFGFWLDMICAVYTAFVTGSTFFLSETKSGNIGLMITQSISLTGMFQWGMKQWSELETQMTSVERVVEYTHIVPEVDESRDKEPPESWPTNCHITFDKVSLKYKQENTFALNDLEFEIKSKEKVGIVGRTGAGKTSIISALFRLIDFEGDVLIDGKSITQFPLKTVRSNISIIPQEPILFSGTVRDNLDPFSAFDDSKLWAVLEEIDLKDFVNNLPLGLETEIFLGGSNLSVGQRQLFCLARALLRETNMLVLDEATANVDFKTDAVIQSLLKKKFDNCTVIIIAHRLNTVMDCDRILVMDSGQVAEFGHPLELLNKEDSVFNQDFVLKSGKAMAATLRKVAEQNYAKRGLSRRKTVLECHCSI